MLPKIPQLKRENASLRHETGLSEILEDQAEGKGQVQGKVQGQSAKKVWWDDQKADFADHLNKKEGHDAVLQQHDSR